MRRLLLLLLLRIPFAVGGAVTPAVGTLWRPRLVQSVNCSFEQPLPPVARFMTDVDLITSGLVLLFLLLLLLS